MARWIEKKDGWHKTKTSTEKGNADYFTRPVPPVRDGMTGHPIGPDGKVNWQRVIQEVNKKTNP